MSGEKIDMLSLYTLVLGGSEIKNLKSEIATGQRNFDIGFGAISKIIDDSAKMLKIHSVDALKLKEMVVYDLLGEANTHNVVESAQEKMSSLLEQDERRKDFRKIFFKIPNSRVKEGHIIFSLKDPDSTSTQDGLFTGQGGILRVSVRQR